MEKRACSTLPCQPRIHPNWLVLPPPAFNPVAVAASRIKSIDLSFFLWPVRLTSREGWIYPNCLPCLYIHHPSSAPRAPATSAALSSDGGRTSSLFLSRNTAASSRCYPRNTLFFSLSLLPFEKSKLRFEREAIFYATLCLECQWIPSGSLLPSHLAYPRTLISIRRLIIATFALICSLRYKNYSKNFPYTINFYCVCIQYLIYLYYYVYMREKIS